MATFRNHARRVADPTLPLEKRWQALNRCVRRFANLVCWQGGWAPLEWHDIRRRLYAQFGIEAGALEAERLVAAAQALDDERNRLLAVQQVLLDRRLAEKRQGLRTFTREGLATWQQWQEALRQCPWVDVQKR